MAILRHLVCLGLVARSLAQHIGLDIPAVDAIVQDTNTKFANYTGLHGSNSTGNLTTSSSNLTRPLLNSLAAVSDPAYWLADIAHQGISAFNPGYQVFRNVKDFGAQGTARHSLSTSHIIWLPEDYLYSPSARAPIVWVSRFSNHY